MTDNPQDAAVRSHYSSLTMHRRCPQAWYYRYELGLKQPEGRVAPERDLGIWWSNLRAAEALERGRKHDSLKGEPSKLKVPGGERFSMKDVTVQDILDSAARWWAGHRNTPDGDGGFAEDQWQARLGVSDAAEALSTLLRRHKDAWADQIKHEHPIAVEAYWERSLPVPQNDTWLPNGYPTMKLIGFFDEVYWDDERGMMVIRDHKTTKNLEASTAVEDMMDSQLQLYAWGASPLVKGWTGKNIRAVAYDRAKSVAPRPPSLTNAGGLRKSGGEPATGMMDLQTYLDWVATEPEYPGTKKDGSNAGVYQAEEKVIEKLSSETAKANWFQRRMTPLNQNLIRTHLRAAVDTSYDSYITTQRVERTAEAGRNLGPACRWCDFATLCRAQMMGGADGTYELEEFGLVGKKGETTLDNGVLT